MNVGVCGAGIFALLDCLPGMAFTLTLFRKRLRLGVRATVAVCALLVVIQVVAGSLRYRHVDDNAYGVDGDTVAGVMGISCDRFDS